MGPFFLSIPFQLAAYLILTIRASFPELTGSLFSPRLEPLECTQTLFLPCLFASYNAWSALTTNSFMVQRSFADRWATPILADILI